MGSQPQSRIKAKHKSHRGAEGRQVNVNRWHGAFLIPCMLSLTCLQGLSRWRPSARRTSPYIDRPFDRNPTAECVLLSLRLESWLTWSCGKGKKEQHLHQQQRGGWYVQEKNMWCTSGKQYINFSGDESQHRNKSNLVQCLVRDVDESRDQCWKVTVTHLLRLTTTPLAEQQTSAFCSHDSWKTTEIIPVDTRYRHINE